MVEPRKQYIKRGSVYYIDKEELLTEVNISLSQNKPTEKLVSMFVLLAERVGLKYTYKNKTDRHDCYTQAVLTLLENWKSVDLEKGHPFAYYTQIVINGYRKGFIDLYPQYNSRWKAELGTGSLISLTDLHGI